jgi:hypothetical protein
METVVLSVQDDLVRAVHREQLSLLVLFDLKAVFDIVHHQILLSVLAGCFRVHGAALNWFSSFLSDHYQMFHYSRRPSANYPVDCSVPHGSVLGPVCFIAYTGLLQLVSGWSPAVIT